MAADTRDKRMSMIGLLRCSTRLFQNPTGTITAAGRAMVAFLYSGIPLGAAALPPAVVIRTFTLVATRASFAESGSRSTTALTGTRNTFTLTASEV